MRLINKKGNTNLNQNRIPNLCVYIKICNCTNKYVMTHSQMCLHIYKSYHTLASLFLNNLGMHTRIEIQLHNSPFTLVNSFLVYNKGPIYNYGWIS